MSNALFNRAFREANETKCRYKVLLGSAGSGKSVNVAQDYILKLSMAQNKGTSLLVVRASESSHLHSTFAELAQAVGRLGLTKQWDIRTSPMSLINRGNGCNVLFRGCNDLRALERLKSVTTSTGNLTWIWIEEATELKSSDFEVIDDRLRGNLEDNQYYQITLTFNPINAQHWIKLNLWDIDSPDIFKLKTTYLQNAFIDDAFKQRMLRRKKIDPDGYQVYGLAEWGDSGGNILFNYSLFKCQQSLEYYDSIVLAQDFGYNHANAILLIGYKDGDMYVLKELYENEKHTAEIIQLANEMEFPKTYPMYCDSAEPDRIKEWKLAGYKALAVRKESGSVQAQIDYLKQRHIYIDPSAVNTFKEIQQWRWKRDTNENALDKPLEVLDDAMACLRYGTEPFRRDSRLKTLPKSAFGIR